MKAFVDKNICIGCGVCTSIASSVFQFADDGLAENIHGEDVPNELENAAKEAEESCPVNAIKVF